MAWVEKLFKGKSRVWVLVDDAGEPVVESGRVSMRYQNSENAKVYNGSVSNLSDVNGAPKAKKSSTKKASNPARSESFDDLVWQKPAGPVVGHDAVPAELANEAESARGVWEFHTDGACSGNPGRCGWGLVMRHDDDFWEAHQYIGIGTNNIAELMAIKVALEHVEDPAAEVHIYSDSQYSIDMLTKGWKAKKNGELINAIKARMKFFEKTPTFFKVKGHAGHPLNERADYQATSSIEE